MMASPGGLRERQRRETHQAIQRAAVALALERGVCQLTVHDISEAAGISQRTFFNHFRSKEEALVPEMEPFDEEAVREFIEAREPDLVTALQTLSIAHIVAGNNHPPDEREHLARHMRLLNENPELLPRTLAIFEALDQRYAAVIAQRTGRDPDSVFCQVVAAVTTAATKAVLDRWRYDVDGGPGPDPSLLKAAFDAIKELVSPS